MPEKISHGNAVRIKVVCLINGVKYLGGGIILNIVDVVLCFWQRITNFVKVQMKIA